MEKQTNKKTRSLNLYSPLQNLNLPQYCAEKNVAGLVQQCWLLYFNDAHHISTVIGTLLQSN